MTKQDSIQNPASLPASTQKSGGEFRFGVWYPMHRAPRDGTEIQAEIPGNGADRVIAWYGGLLDSDEQSCGGWTFTRDQEPPDCWTDGVCWEVNEDGEPSVKPTRWKLLPPDQRDDDCSDAVESADEEGA